MPLNLVNGALERLHDDSLPAISLLQSSFPNSYRSMINISTLFDPRYVFLIYAPLLFALNKRVGQRLILALTWAEWANQCLKWLLAGDRPYWYAEERAHELRNLTLSAGDYLEQPLSLVSLKQFPATCELGAGSPSGHAMVTATVWYILIDAFLKGELNPLRHHHSRVDKDNSCPQLVARISWFAYALALLLVSLSRVYLACHFPHQCLTGALLGALMARLVVAEQRTLERLNRRHFVLATMWMFASAMATYAALQMNGFDPLWSVGKAMRWCANSAYIHLDTTPFFSMMRYLGFALGAGLAFKPAARTSERSKEDPQLGQVSATTEAGAQVCSYSLAGRRALTGALAVGMGQLLSVVPLSRTNQELFYVATFLLYVLFAYIIAAPLPALVKRLVGGQHPPQRHFKQQQ